MHGGRGSTRDGDNSARDVKIRDAAQADIPSIVAIEKSVFPDPWSAASFASTLRYEGNRVRVAESGTTIVGYTVARNAADQAELANIAVTPDRQRLGVGAALLQDVIDQAWRRGAATLFLEVRESNAAARAMYERAGFRQVGRRKWYYEHPREDALVLSLERPV